MPGSICDVLPSAAALLGAPGAVDKLALADWIGLDAKGDRVDRVAVVLGHETRGLRDVPVDDAPCGTLGAAARPTIRQPFIEPGESMSDAAFSRNDATRSFASSMRRPVIMSALATKR